MNKVLSTFVRPAWNHGLKNRIHLSMGGAAKKLWPILQSNTHTDLELPKIWTCHNLTENKLSWSSHHFLWILLIELP